MEHSGVTTTARYRGVSLVSTATSDSARVSRNDAQRAMSTVLNSGGGGNGGPEDRPRGAVHLRRCAATVDNLRLKVS
jgi:hypothetical protein